MVQYSTNRTDKQWQVIENILDPKHRKRKNSLRDVMDTVLYLTKADCQWRMFPKDFMSHDTVFYFFNKWIVERFFSWLENFRRIAMDYELCSNTAETMV